jgi:hypothetical protein
MSARNAQRKLGTTHGSPRRSRTAKASRISRHAVKSRCAREWGGWDRLSDDGPGHYNLDLSEGPWGGGSRASKAVHDRIHGPTLSGITVAITKCTKGGCKPDVGRRMSGAGLNRQTFGKAPLESQPSSRTGENPPYGMRGGIVETSASFEARSAPRSYPTTRLEAFPNAATLAETVPGLDADALVAIAAPPGTSKESLTSCPKRSQKL